MAPDGSKEHRKRLAVYPPNDPWYQENVTREKLKYHPPAATVLAAEQAPTPAPWAACVPTPLASGTNVAAASAPYKVNPTLPQLIALPNNWHRTTDKVSGRPFYYHGETQEVRWDPPKVTEC